MGLTVFLLRKTAFGKALPLRIRLLQGVVAFGFAVSLAGLLWTQGVVRGFETEYRRALLGFQAHVDIQPYAGITVSEALVRENVDPEILQSVTPYLYRETLLVHAGKIRGAVLKGVPRGEMPSGKEDGLVLGRQLASALGWREGPLKLFIPSEGANGGDFRTLPVRGEFQSGLFELDSQFALIPLDLLQALFGLEENFFGYQLRLSDPFRAPEVAAALRKKLEPFAAVSHWIETHQALFEALELEKWGFRILMGMMILMAGFNFVGVVLLMVYSKKRLIALLQSLGLSPFKVRRLFACHAALIGLFGLAAGIALAVAGASWIGAGGWVRLEPEIYFLDRLPMVLEWQTIFVVAGFALLLIGITTWLAAGGVTRFTIREGLHEPA